MWQAKVLKQTTLKDSITCLTKLRFVKEIELFVVL